VIRLSIYPSRARVRVTDERELMSPDVTAFYEATKADLMRLKANGAKSQKWLQLRRGSLGNIRLPPARPQFPSSMPLYLGELP
jgi:hypothetical protein